jgi:hypothetical protein
MRYVCTFNLNCFKKKYISLDALLMISILNFGLQEDLANKKTSILDKDPEAKAMICLLDKGPVSEGIRDTDAQADIPEVHSILSSSP